MHAFVTRHRIIVIAILLLSTLAFLGLYARGRLATDGARPAPPASHVQNFGQGRATQPSAT